MGQIESDGVFVSGVKAQEPMITGSLVLVLLYQWDNKNHDFIKICFLIFGIQIKMSSDMLCPHHTHFATSDPVM